MWQKIKSLFFKNQGTRQTVAKNTFWLTVSNFGGRALRAVLVIYAARLLGADGWGVFSYAISLVAFITSFMDIGINSILIRETVKAEGDAARRKVLSTAFITKTVGLALGILAVLFITPHVTSVKEVNSILGIIIFVLIFDTFRDFGFNIIRSLEKMEWEAALYILTNVAILAFGIVFLLLSKSVQSLALSYAIGDSVGLIATYWLLKNHLGGLLRNFSKSTLKMIFLSAWPFAISGILGVLMLNADILIIGWLKSATDVGLYSAAQRIVQLIYLIPAIIGISALPTFSRLANKDNAKMRRVIERLVSLTFAFGIPIAIGGFILGGPLILLIFGQAYAGGIPSFQILILTILADFPAVIFSGLIFSYDRQRTLILNSVIAGTLNILFDFLLIPHLGITGSAIATFLAQFISMRYLWWIAKRTNRFEVLPYLTRVFLAAAAMGAVAFGLNAAGLEVLVNIAISGAVYAGILFFLREPLIKEMKLILRPDAPVESLAPVEPGRV